VQVRAAGTQQWNDVTGLVLSPAYTFPTGPADLVGFQVFELAFDPVVGDGIRLYGDPGGTWDFVGVAELRALARPAVYPTKPVNYDVALTVIDDLGNTDCAITTISVNNSPPLVTLVSPVHGTSFSNTTAQTFALQAAISDAEQHPNKLSCGWQVLLHHDNHVHPEPPLVGCGGQATLQPHDPDPGDVVYYEVRLTVTDSLGLATSSAAFLYPDDDCNLNGVDDAIDIALGTSFDVDSNGVPDECQADCNANGVQDPFDIVLGTSLDGDGNGIPDECE
jgi:hypothetical protein